MRSRRPAALERRDQAADAGVDVGDFAVVGRRLESGGERRRRIVRRVCVVQVHPAEERLRRAGRATQRRVDDRLAAPLHLQLEPVAEAGEVGVEGVEPLREAVRRGEDERADEPAGAVAASLEISAAVVTHSGIGVVALSRTPMRAG